jgi:integrase
MADLLIEWQALGLSASATDILLNSWAPSTQKQYNSALKKWSAYLVEHELSPLSPSIANIVNFLTLQSQGLSYSAINTLRSALSSFYSVFDEGIGQLFASAIVCRFMKGLFKRKPPAPKYGSVWDVQIILDHLDKMGDSDKLPLKELTFRLTMLLALASPKRCNEIAALTLENCQSSESSFRFFLSKTKNRGFGKQHEALYTEFTENRNLCPVSNLRAYLEQTKAIRISQRILLSFKRPHNPVSSITVARWLKETIMGAGIEGFSAHSTRAASTSAAAFKGLSTAAIMQAANWRPNGSTFQRFYHKPIEQVSFQDTVFSRKVFKQSYS